MSYDFQSKILRNAGCICGSGLKYKKCCGALSSGHASKKEVFLSDQSRTHLSSYEIQQDTPKDLSYEQLTPNTQKRIAVITSKLSTEPQEVIPELKQLIIENPKVSLLWNYLTKAYAQLKNREKVEELILKTYLEFPDYLFAKTAYGELCLDKGNYSKIAEIFQGKFTLPALYPHRKSFQVAEVVAFYQLMVHYFCLLGQYKLATEQLHIIEKVAP